MNWCHYFLRVTLPKLTLWKFNGDSTVWTHTSLQSIRTQTLQTLTSLHSLVEHSSNGGHYWPSLYLHQIMGEPLHCWKKRFREQTTIHQQTYGCSSTQSCQLWHHCKSSLKKADVGFSMEVECDTFHPGRWYHLPGWQVLHLASMEKPLPDNYNISQHQLV